ncbi:reverse transcriptase domain-containing protein [Tanacetum coccineum]|uniref:Reverse transcriptase domain-containing protein n=1 Tax=Tanacetum coccineum TaxID=301880 RepID=A0ABQ4Y786_9ASTR
MSEITTYDPLYPNQPSFTPVVNNETNAKEDVPVKKENINTLNLGTHLSSTLYHPFKLSCIPFPSRLRKQKKVDDREKFLLIFKHININLPFLEALDQMPKGARVLKNLLSNKNLPQKKGYPGSFTLTRLIGTLLVKNASVNLEASINLMPQSLFMKLGILELKLTRMSIQLADRSIKYPIVTARAVIDIQDGKLSLRVVEESEPVGPLEWKVLENRLNPSMEEPPKVELMALPDSLEYAFLQGDDQLPAFETLKKELSKAPIMVKPDWSLPFEFMCDASDYAVGVVLRQRSGKYFQPIYYASKTMTEAQENYTTTKKELMVVVLAFDFGNISFFPKQ